MNVTDNHYAHATPRQVEYLDAVMANNGNVAAAARSLGLVKQTLHNSLKNLEKHLVTLGESKEYELYRPGGPGMFLSGFSDMRTNAEGKPIWYKFQADKQAMAQAIQEFVETAASGRIPNQKSYQFYPTPDDVADIAIDYAEAGDCYSGYWLEPEAGIGNLANRMPHELTTCIEISPLHCRILESQAGYADVINADFMSWQTEQRFKRIVMNPPYSEGRWQAHTEKAATLLAPGGRLIAVLPASSKDKFTIEGFNCCYSDVLKNRFSGTGIDVVILVAEALENSN